jgi:hypothetical protein
MLESLGMDCDVWRKDVCRAGGGVFISFLTWPVDSTRASSSVNQWNEIWT